MEEIRKYLTVIDFYGRDIKFTYKGKEKVFSELGGMLVLLSIVFCLVFVYILGKEMIIREKPSIISQFSKSPVIPYVSVGVQKDWNMYIFALDNVKSNILDDTVVNITFDMYEYYSNKTIGLPNLTLQSLPFTKCSKNLNFPDIPRLEENTMSKASCLLPNQTIEIGSSPTQAYGPSSAYKVLRLSVKKCINSTTKKNCKNLQEIDQKLMSTSVVFGSYDYLIDLKNYQAPLTLDMVSLSTLTDPKLKKEMKYFLKTNKIIDDVGMFSQEIREKQYFSPKNYLLESSDIPETQEVLIIYILLDNEIQFIYRSYIKVYSIIAEIGGFFNFVHIVFRYLVFQYSSVIFDNEIMNQIFTFHNQKNRLGTILQTHEEVLVKQTIKVRRNPNPKESTKDKIFRRPKDILSPESNEKPVQIAPPTILKVEGDSIKPKDLSIMNIWRIILSGASPCCRYSLMSNVPSYFRELESEVRDMMELSNYIKVQEEIKKLKYLFLTDDQRFAFNNLTKPSFGGRNLYRIERKGDEYDARSDEYKGCIESLINDESLLSRKLLKLVEVMVDSPHDVKVKSSN